MFGQVEVQPSVFLFSLLCRKNKTSHLSRIKIVRLVGRPLFLVSPLLGSQSVTD